MSREYTDEQHIALYREGKKGHLEALMDRYEGMIRSKAGTMFLIGGDEQDLRQEGRIGLLNAIRDYDFGRDASFATFADLCVARQMYKAVQSSGRLKNLPLNEYISLYSGRVGEDEDSQLIVDSLAADATNEPEHRVMDDEAEKEIMNLIQTRLSDRERDVFMLNIAGIPSAQAAAILAIDSKAADNALQRAKSKLRKALTKV